MNFQIFSIFRGVQTFSIIKRKRRFTNAWLLSDIRNERFVLSILYKIFKEVCVFSPWETQMKKSIIAVLVVRSV